MSFHRIFQKFKLKKKKENKKKYLAKKNTNKINKNNIRNYKNEALLEVKLALKYSTSRKNSIFSEES